MKIHEEVFLWIQYYVCVFSCKRKAWKADIKGRYNRYKEMHIEPDHNWLHVLKLSTESLAEILESAQ